MVNLIAPAHLQASRSLPDIDGMARRLSREPAVQVPDRRCDGVALTLHGAGCNLSFDPRIFYI
jgi:hypothetical protein